ncbi:IclR family transcriptional regulator [Amorphus sp. 3PC139-8]|uniref:IclR family transcriptional regulator n=1 Tax=Amorphus sp. 3PC139-8 TaxID=2735676 RepID=UPI00345C676A
MTVKQVANVLDLLEFFAARGKPASLAEIAQHFGWPRSSAFNLLSTLVERGYLYEPKRRGGYYPTPRWLALAREISAAEPLPDEVPTLLRELAKTTGETVWIASASGQHAVLLEVIQSEHAVRYTAEVGKRVPLHATATGQAIISQMPETQQASVLRKAVFERYSEGTPMSIDAVEQSIRRSLARGWFESASAFSHDLGGVSVPLVLDGRVFSLTVAGPLFRVRERMEEIAGALQSAVKRHLGADYFTKNVPNLATLP